MTLTFLDLLMLSLMVMGMIGLLKLAANALGTFIGFIISKIKPSDWRDQV